MRNNIRIDGVVENEKESLEETAAKVKEIVNQKLNVMENIILEGAYRVGLNLAKRTGRLHANCQTIRSKKI